MNTRPTMAAGRLAGVLTLALLLSACASIPGLKTPEVKTTVRVVNSTTYPELPDIQLPVEPTLTPWQYDIPRDMSKLEAANTGRCQSVAEKDRDDAYWARCGIHPVIPDSNVLYGYDQRNWNIMLSNFGKLREYIFELKARIGLANDSRREWRRKAEEERKKAAAAQEQVQEQPQAKK